MQFRCRRTIRAVITATSAVCALATPVLAQQGDSAAAAAAAAAPHASFIGNIVSSADSAPVHAADIRLLYVDSVKTVRLRSGKDSVEVFPDTVRSRVGITNGAGRFSVLQLSAGHYLVTVRRIGFEPLQAGLVVDSTPVKATFVMHEISHMLAKVVVTENAVDKVKQRLDRMGFTDRLAASASGTFVDRKEILHRQAQNIAELLSYYGVHDGEFVLDKMPVDYALLEDYPAELVIGVEIYRHNRPVDYNATRSGPGALSPGSSGQSTLVLIWTYIP